MHGQLGMAAFVRTLQVGGLVNLHLALHARSVLRLKLILQPDTSDASQSFAQLAPEDTGRALFWLEAAVICSCLRKRLRCKGLKTTLSSAGDLETEAVENLSVWIMLGPQIQIPKSRTQMRRFRLTVYLTA